MKSFGKTHRQVSPSDLLHAVYFTFNRSYLINTIKHKVNLDLATQWRKSGKGKRECCLLDWNVSLDAGLSKHSIVFLTWREKQLDASPTCGL